MISKSRFWFLPAFLLTLNLCLAEAPSGLVRFTAAELGVPVYDLTGGLNFEQQLDANGASIPLNAGFELSHDAKGRLTGAGTTMVTVGPDVVGATYKATGRVTRGSGFTRVLIVVRMSGVGVVAGVNTEFSIRLNYNLIINNGVLTGRVSGKASFGSLGSGRVQSLITADLPEGTNGEWELWMNVVPLSRLSGNGFILIPAKERTLSGNVKGKYIAHQNISKVSFKGVNEGRGSGLSVRFFTEGGFHTLQQAKGKVLGQRVDIR